jgi:hypothetical protein
MKRTILILVLAAFAGSALMQTEVQASSVKTMTIKNVKKHHHKKHHRHKKKK